jgi:hypothetical protein
MTAYTTYANGDTVADKSGAAEVAAPARTVFRGFFDASKRNLAAADTMVVLTIPANTWVEQCFVKVDTIDATQTVDIGDGDTADGWGEDLSLAVATTVHDPDADFNAAAGQAGKLYTSETDILITVPTDKALDTAKFEVVMPATLLG